MPVASGRDARWPRRQDACAPDKFVNLDMEEYRDLALTVAAFRGALDEPEFRALSAGIVLQAYLPDSCAAQRELTLRTRCVTLESPYIPEDGARRS